MTTQPSSLLANAILSVEDRDVCIRSAQDDLLYKFTPYPGFGRTTEQLSTVLSVSRANAEAVAKRDGVPVSTNPVDEAVALLREFKENFTALMNGYHTNDDSKVLFSALMDAEDLAKRVDSVVAGLNAVPTPPVSAS